MTKNHPQEKKPKQKPPEAINGSAIHYHTTILIANY